MEHRSSSISCSSSDGGGGAADAAPPHAPPQQAPTSSEEWDLLLKMGDLMLGLPNNSAYLTALEKCPLLLGQESSLLRFLRFCKNDALAAARRLSAYWNLRLETFGPDRCYRPMIDFSGQGALEEDILQFLSKSKAFILPPNKDGKMMFFADYSNTNKSNKKLGMSEPFEQKSKGVFFFFQILSQLECTLANGATHIHLIQENRHSVSPSMVRFVKRATGEVFPVAMDLYQCLLSPRDLHESRRLYFTKNTIPYIWQILSTACGVVRPKMVFLSTEKGTSINVQRAAIAKFLIDQSGIHPDFLPESAGGTWSYQKMKEIIMGDSSNGGGLQALSGLTMSTPPPSLQDPNKEPKSKG